MPRNHYLLAEIIYFCSNLIILFASIWESTTQYKLAYLYPPGYTPATSVNPPCALDLEYFHPHHPDLPPGCAKETILPAMKEIPTAPPCPTRLLLMTLVVPHNGSWLPLATAVNYLVRIVPIMHMAFQAQPASPAGVQPDSVYPTTKATKQKASSSKKDASKPSPKPLPKPSPETSPDKSPDHSTGGEKAYGFLTDHSFYHSASDEEPTNKRCQAHKTHPIISLPHMRCTATSPILLPNHQALLILAHLGMNQSPTLITSLASTMPLLAPGIICWPIIYAMLMAGLRFLLSCQSFTHHEHQRWDSHGGQWGFKSRHYTCKDCSWPVQLNTEHWDKVQII
ncbi:hypothetical protein DSO57_1026794 [Entomophthora muscae]|uniref:Uncharacterized protein n=1 Tax=Entomophthora muscae TaxID=34485 RepID=A0ACC2U013_9FUNG|nr:hypothetical protein DSO57_1026794 [Entomophthora muscae]